MLAQVEGFSDFHFISAILKIPFSLIPQNGRKIARKGATITHSDKILFLAGGFRGKSEENLILINSFLLRFRKILFNALFTNTSKRRKNCTERYNNHTF